MFRHLVRVTTFLLLVASSGVPSLADGTAKAVIKEPIHDFGDLDRGERASTTFVIENQGDAELILERVVSTCACLIAEYDERIPPDGKGEIKVELDTLTVQGPSSSFIEVSTNDPENPTLQLTIRSKVENAIYAYPGYVQYRAVQGFRERAAVGQVLWSPDGTPFTITRVESPYTYVAVSYREATAEERQRTAGKTTGEGPFFWIETVLSPDAPVGPMGGFIKIYVEHPRQSVVPIPVSGFMRPVFAVTPHEAHFGELVVADEALYQEFTVKNFATETIPITKVDTDVKGLEVTIEEEKAGRTWLVTLTIPPNIPKGPFAGALRIHTASDRAPLITVPLTGTIL